MTSRVDRDSTSAAVTLWTSLGTYYYPPPHPTQNRYTPTPWGAESSWSKHTGEPKHLKD